MTKLSPLSPANVMNMNRQELSILWRKRFKKPVPTTIGTPMMKRIIAFETQAQIYGGIDT